MEDTFNNVQIKWYLTDLENEKAVGRLALEVNLYGQYTFICKELYKKMTVNLDKQPVLDLGLGSTSKMQNCLCFISIQLTVAKTLT